MNKATPIPSVAAEHGFDRLVFADDFESMATVDIHNEKKPDALWYVDRAYRRPPYTPEELEWHTDESFLRILSQFPGGISTASSTTGGGFTFQNGYVEGRIRLQKMPKEEISEPLFYLLTLPDFLGKAWVDNGICSVFTCSRTRREKESEKAPYYVGSLFHYNRGWERDKNGKPVTRSASNLVNSTGYRDWFTFLDEEWHTYGLLWEKGHIAWYMDGKEMHSVRFGVGELPRHYYRSNPYPVPPLESTELKFANRTWLGAYTVFDNEPMVISLLSRADWPMDVDWVRVWQK